MLPVDSEERNTEVTSPLDGGDENSSLNTKNVNYRPNH